MFAALHNLMKLSATLIVCLACHAEGVGESSGHDLGALVESQGNHRIETKGDRNDGRRMREAHLWQDRLFSSRSGIMQQWHRCDPETEVDSDEGVSAVPDEWITAEAPQDCDDGMRGRLLIDGGDPFAGFATEFFLYMINHILFAERRCLEPVIIMTCAGAPLWFDPVSRQNPWEWYFEPLNVAHDTPLVVYKMTPEQKDVMHREVSWAVHTGYYGDVELAASDFDEPWFRRMRSVGHRVVRQYFIVKPTIVREVQELWDAHFSGATHVLGMHYRGGDKAGSYRTGFDNVSSYLDYAEAFLEAYPRGKIMLATDDIDVEMEMLNGTWPAAVKKALIVPDHLMEGHSKAFDATWTETAASTELRGKAVLFDILLLAKANFLIYGQSAVVESVFYLNKHLHTSSIPVWFQRPKASKEWFWLHDDPKSTGDEIVESTPSPTHTASVSCAARAAYEEYKARQFQRELTRLQTPVDCVCARQLIYTSPNTEGFAHMVHVFGFMLMAGVMSERTILPIGDMAYCPADAPRRDFFCVFDAVISPCSHKKSYKSKCGKGPNHPASFDNKYGSRWSEDLACPWALLSGPKRSLRMEEEDGLFALSVYRTGVVSSKYLEMGNFWFRSQIQGWAWRLKPSIQQYIAKHPLTVSLRNKKYIGIHIRASDNLAAVSEFGFDVRTVISLQRALKIADDIRAIDTTVSTILLTTDSRAVVREATQTLPHLEKRGWQMHWAHNSIRAKKGQQTQFDWFRDNRSSMGFDIILDIESLRNADYLVGSMLSNVFRLSVELNYARKTSEGVLHEFCDTEQYVSLDTPWIQDL